jgi:hypothetical protein
VDSMDAKNINDLDVETKTGLLRVRVMYLENGLIILLSDSSKFRLGNTAVSIPEGRGRNEPTSTTLFSNAIDSTLARTLAERISSWTEQACILVVSVKDFDRASTMGVMRALKQHLQQE